MNICQCGAQASYPHDPACPFPLYSDRPMPVAAWTALYEARLAKIEADAALARLLALSGDSGHTAPDSDHPNAHDGTVWSQ